MQRSCKEFKRIARENLTNKYGLPIKAYLYTILITSLVEIPFTMLQTQEQFSLQNIIFYLAEILIAVLSVVLTCGEYRLHLTLAKGKNATMADYFYPIKNQPDRYIFGQLMYFGIMFLAALPILVAYILTFFLKGGHLLMVIPLLILGLILVIFAAMNFNLIYFFLLFGVCNHIGRSSHNCGCKTNAKHHTHSDFKHLKHLSF